MSHSIQQYIQGKLKQRKEENNFRSLRIVKGLIDFYSNDYLGLARNIKLRQRIELELAVNGLEYIGSTGSRLLSGNNEYAESLEKFLAEFYGSESALLINSGFDANYGLLSALPYRGDAIIYDELVHASIHDGMRSGKANSVSFAHNNLVELEERLTSSVGLKYVVVESVYSMDGDFAPLKEIAALCKKYDAGLIVDEAHATGVFGKAGRGRIAELQLEKNCVARVNTFGKAMGAHGAVILCSEDLKNFLINYCRPFIFSTALPFHSLAAIRCAHEYLQVTEERREKIFQLIALFKKQFRHNPKLSLIESSSPIQSILVAGNENVKQFAQQIQQSGLDVRPIVYPTVAKGKERIRICLHSFNTEEEVIKLATVINSL